MNKTLTASFFTLVAASLAGCGSQAGTDYEGESLLSITGKVLIENDQAPAELVPALAFLREQRSHGSSGGFDIVDAKVRGDFPARFTMDVLEPPATGSFLSVFHAPGEPRLALAYVTAVTPDHPETIELGSIVAFSSCNFGADGKATDCSQENVRCAPGYDYETLGDPTGEECFHEVKTCDVGFKNCALDHTSGDSKLANNVWQNFAGLSKNLMVVYLETEAGAGTWTSHLFGGDATMPAGYHLVELVPATAEEIDAANVCTNLATNAGIERYNEKHGTSYSSLSDIPEDDLAARGEAEGLLTAEAVQRKCLVVTNEHRMVPTSADHPVSVEIGTDVTPIVGI